MKVVLQAAAFIVVFGSDFAYAAPPTCSACGIIRGAPSPEIGDGVIGVAVTAVLLFALIALPRISRWMKTRTA